MTGKELGENQERSTARTEARAASLRVFDAAVDDLLRHYNGYLLSPLTHSMEFLDARANVVRLFSRAAR